MEILANPIVAIALLLGILVFVHECGHFFVGKWVGMYPEQFSIGFGPALVEKQIKGTTYRLGLIPLGGYVKFYGATPSEQVPDFAKGHEEHSADSWRKALMISAGPVANFLLTFAAYMLLGYIGVPALPAKVGEVLKGSPAQEAGFQFGDQVLAVNGKPIASWRELQTAIIESPGKPLDVSIDRGGNKESITVKPRVIPTDEVPMQQTKGQLGISPASIPSIITVSNPNSVAYQKGLRTGDRIVSLYFNGKEPGSDAPALRYWHELEGILASPTAPLKSLGMVVERKLLTEEEPSSSPNTDDKAKSAAAEAAEAKVKTEKIAVNFGAEDLASGNFDAFAQLDLKPFGIHDAQLTVKSLGKGYSAPFQVGDRLIAFAGTSVDSVFGLQDLLKANQQPTVPITIDRAGEKKVVDVTLKAIDIQKLEGKGTFYALPVAFMGSLESFPQKLIKFSAISDLAAYAYKQTMSQVAAISHALYGLVTGEMPLAALGGPISIAVVATESVKHGFVTFLTAIALISVNLGLLNLFPIPALDGGRLVVIGLEALTRRPLSEKAMENFQKIGFAMVFSLIIIATYNDVSRFWSTLIKGLSGNG